MRDRSLAADGSLTATGARAPSALALAWRQYRLERSMFWRNPSAAFFNFLLPLLFLAARRRDPRGNQHDLNLLVPSIAGMSVMSTTFTALAYNIVFLRERGVLKRMRGTPLPTISYFGGVAANAVTNTAMQIAIIVLAGRLFFGIGWPRDWAQLIVFVRRRRRLLCVARRRLRARDPQLRVDRGLRERGLPAGRVRLLLRVRLAQRPGVPVEHRPRAAAEAADRGPVGGDGHRRRACRLTSTRSR